MKIYQVQCKYLDGEWEDMYMPFLHRENAEAFIKKHESKNYQFKIVEDFMWFGDTPGYEEYRNSL